MRTYFRKPIPGDASDPESLSARLERYLLYLETHHYSAATVSILRLTMGKFILWCHERSVTQAREVTREMVERYQRHLYYYRKRNGQPLALSSQTHWLVGLRGWFRWLVREHYLEVDPAAHLELPRDEQRLPRHALSPSEAEAILAQPDIATPLGLRDRAIMETLYSTGLRREEVLRLDLSDLDRERSTVLVRCGKGHKDHFVPIGAGLWPGCRVCQARRLMPSMSPITRPTTMRRALTPNAFFFLVTLTGFVRRHRACWSAGQRVYPRAWHTLLLSRPPTCVTSKPCWAVPACPPR